MNVPLADYLKTINANVRQVARRREEWRKVFPDVEKAFKGLVEQLNRDSSDLDGRGVKLQVVTHQEEDGLPGIAIAFTSEPTGIIKTVGNTRTSMVSRGASMHIGIDMNGMIGVAFGDFRLEWGGQAAREVEHHFSRWFEPGDFVGNSLEAQLMEQFLARAVANHWAAPSSRR